MWPRVDERNLKCDFHRHKYIQTHSNTYRYIQIHTNTYKHIQIHTETYRYIQIHTHTYRYIQIHAGTYRYIQIHTHTYTYYKAQQVLQVCTYIHQCFNTCTCNSGPAGEKTQLFPVCTHQKICEHGATQLLTCGQGVDKRIQRCAGRTITTCPAQSRTAGGNNGRPCNLHTGIDTYIQNACLKIPAYGPGYAENITAQTQMLHVGNIYLHFPLNVAIFHLMWVNNPYMDPMGN